MTDRYQPLRDALAESSAYFRFPGECTYCKPDGPAANMLRALLADNDRLREALAVVTATLEWLAHGGCRSADGPILSSADAVAMGKAALAALNGADHA